MYFNSVNIIKASIVSMETVHFYYLMTRTGVRKLCLIGLFFTACELRISFIFLKWKRKRQRRRKMSRRRKRRLKIKAEIVYDPQSLKCLQNAFTENVFWPKPRLSPLPNNPEEKQASMPITMNVIYPFNTVYLHLYT